MIRLQDFGNGWTEFQGSPAELLEGDVVLDETFILKTNPVSAKHFSKEGFVSFDLAAMQDGADGGRATLAINTELRFRRETDGGDGVDLIHEPECFEEIVECCTEQFCKNCDTVHAAELGLDLKDHCVHDHYFREWRGQTVDLPYGAMVGVNLQPRGQTVYPSVKFVDSVYPTGAVVFSDGTAYQSHPNYEWVAWRDR